MICADCAKAADLYNKVEATRQLAKDQGFTSSTWLTNPILPVHPHDCECTCQHRIPGSWKGRKTED